MTAHPPQNAEALIRGGSEEARAQQESVSEHTSNVRWLNYVGDLLGSNGRFPLAQHDRFRLREIADGLSLIADQQATIERLAYALAQLCPLDAPCLCADWMVTPAGSKCYYCTARAALAEFRRQQV